MAMAQKQDYVVTVHDDISVDIKHNIILQDIQLWKNTRFQAEIRKRAYARNNMPEQLKEQITMLERCEGMLLDLEEHLKN